MQRKLEEDREPDSRRGAVVGLLIIVALIVGSLYLYHVLHDASEIQDCVMSGRTNCAPIDPASVDGK